MDAPYSPAMKPCASMSAIPVATAASMTGSRGVDPTPVIGPRISRVSPLTSVRRVMSCCCSGCEGCGGCCTAPFATFAGLPSVASSLCLPLLDPACALVYAQRG